jgi:hypothetical protein
MPQWQEGSGFLGTLRPQVQRHPRIPNRCVVGQNVDTEVTPRRNKL